MVGRGNVYSQLSGLEDVFFSDFIKDYFVPEGVGGGGGEECAKVEECCRPGCSQA